MGGISRSEFLCNSKSLSRRGFPVPVKGVYVCTRKEL